MPRDTEEIKEISAFRVAVFYIVFSVFTSMSFFLSFCLSFLPLEKHIALSRITIGGLVLWISRRFAGIDYRLENRDLLPNSPFIIASSQQSSWDPFVYFYLFRCSVVYEQRMSYYPVFYSLMKRWKMISIDQYTGKKSFHLFIKQCRDAIASGAKCIVIFPQGRSVIEGNKAKLLPGIHALYKRLRLPVVPLASNSGLYWPTKGFKMKKGTIRLRLQEPIHQGLSRSEFMELLEERIYS